MQKYAEFIVPRSDDGTPLGYTSMYANNVQTRTAYISMFCIRTNYQKLHLGTKLMNKAIEVARQNGMVNIRLEVLKDNTKAQKFYSRCGFHVMNESNGTSFMMEYHL